MNDAKIRGTTHGNNEINQKLLKNKTEKKMKLNVYTIKHNFSYPAALSDRKSSAETLIGSYIRDTTLMGDRKQEDERGCSVVLPLNISC